jgi:hypothetical protein
MLRAEGLELEADFVIVNRDVQIAHRLNDEAEIKILRCLRLQVGVSAAQRQALRTTIQFREYRIVSSRRATRAVHAAEDGTKDLGVNTLQRA